MKEIISLEGKRENKNDGICMGAVGGPFPQILVSLSGKLFFFFSIVRGFSPDEKGGNRCLICSVHVSINMNY